MFEKFKNFVFIIPVFFALFFPMVSGAITGVPGPDPNAPPSAPALATQYKLENPIKVDSVQDLLLILLNLVIVIATPIVVLFIILAGFKYVTARGNASEIESATQSLTYAVIGGVLIIGAVAIAEIIKNLVNSFG
jgi:hypothetical protein